MVTTDEIKIVLGAVVKELRTRKALTQEKLAEHIGVEMQTISAIEGGKTFISCEVLTKLCNFFEISPSVFFSEQPNIFSNENLDYYNKIKFLLPKFSQSKLKEIYDILCVMQK